MSIALGNPKDSVSTSATAVSFSHAWGHGKEEREEQDWHVKLQWYLSGALLYVSQRMQLAVFIKFWQCNDYSIVTILTSVVPHVHGCIWAVKYCLTAICKVLNFQVQTHAHTKNKTQTYVSYLSWQQNWIGYSAGTTFKSLVTSQILTSCNNHVNKLNIFSNAKSPQ